MYKHTSWGVILLLIMKLLLYKILLCYKKPLYVAAALHWFQECVLILQPLNGLFFHDDDDDDKYGTNFVVMNI